MVRPLYTPNTCLSILPNYTGNERNGKEVREIALVEQKPRSIQTEPYRNGDPEIKMTVSKPGVKEILKYVKLHATLYWKSSLKVVLCRWYLTPSESKQNCCPLLKLFLTCEQDQQVI